MAEEKKIASWEDFDGVVQASTAVVTLPSASARVGKDVNVRIRAITPMELVKAFNFPLDEINKMVAEGKDGAAFTNAMQEHAATFGITELLDAMKRTIAIGLVEPDPRGGNIEAMQADWRFLFTKITELTTPGEALAEAAGFRPDGE